MKYTNDLAQRSQELVILIKEAEKSNKPIEKLVKEQIAIMEAHKDEFVKQAQKEGLDDFSIARVEVQLCSNIKFWAKKINLPVDKYDKMIKQIQNKFISD